MIVSCQISSCSNAARKRTDAHAWYADSSFLVSCYLVDANTPRAKAFLSEHHGPLPFTALHELEVRNALRLGVFRRVITDDQAKAAAAALDADLRDGRLVRTAQPRRR